MTARSCESNRLTSLVTHANVARPWDPLELQVIPSQPGPVDRAESPPSRDRHRSGSRDGHRHLVRTLIRRRNTTRMDASPSSNPWDWIYATRAMDAVGWYEPDPFTSRELVAEAVARGARSIIDVGGGASRLVDHLVGLDLDRVGVLDVSEAGLALARHRLGTRADAIEWIVADMALVGAVGAFDIWHDRAAFHFLLDAAAQQHYARLAERTVPIGGVAIIATFADDGPERCSGMPIVRYEPEQLASTMGDGFRLIGSRQYLHHTPAGVPQQFQYSMLERVIQGSTRGRVDDVG